MLNETFIGIDISKEQLDVHVLPKAVHFTCQNDASGIEFLVSRLQEENPALIIMEASGGHEITLAAELGAAGLPLAIVNPRQVRDFARGIGKLAKTDAIDAFVLARFGETNRPEPQPIPTDEQKQIKELVTRRRQLVALRVSEKHRIHSARSTRVQQSIRTVLATIAGELEAIDRDIDDLIRNSPVWREKEQLLRTFKGVGPVTARIVVAKLPELGKVDRQEIACLVGLAPLNKDSGKMRGKRMITGGRKEVRDALYMAAVCAIRHNKLMKPFYERLTKAGKAYKVAIVACMRKMLVILNAMVRENQPFQVISP
jgi:transposase